MLTTITCKVYINACYASKFTKTTPPKIFNPGSAYRNECSSNEKNEQIFHLVSFYSPINCRPLGYKLKVLW